MRVLHIAGLAIIFAVVRSTTSTASGQGWATKPYENPSGYARPATRPNVHAIYKREIPTSTRSGQHQPTRTLPWHLQPDLLELIRKQAKEPNISPPIFHPPPRININEAILMASSMSGQHSQPESTETMTDDHPEHHHRPRPVITQKPGANIHKPLHTGMTSTMSGQHSQPESTGTMTDDHPEHHRPRPVMTQNPGPIPEIPLMSSEADSEEHTMPPVMTEDNAMMPSEEFTNAPESNEAMNEEMSEHDEVISVHEFKEVLHELVQEFVEKIVVKIIGKFKIVHDRETSGRDPQSCHNVNVNANVNTNTNNNINQNTNNNINNNINNNLNNNINNIINNILNANGR